MIKLFCKIIKGLMLAPIIILLIPVIALGYMCLLGLSSAVGFKSSGKCRIWHV